MSLSGTIKQKPLNREAFVGKFTNNSIEKISVNKYLQIQKMLF